MQVHRRLVLVALAAIRLVCGVLGDAVEEMVESETSPVNESIDAQAKLRDIVDGEHGKSTRNSRVSASKKDVLTNEERDPFFEMRKLKKGKKSSKAKAARKPRAPSRSRSPTTQRPVAPTSRSKGAKVKAPNSFIHVRR
jgi:hypothetical protein